MGHLVNRIIVREGRHTCTSANKAPKDIYKISIIIIARGTGPLTLFDTAIDNSNMKISMW